MATTSSRIAPLVVATAVAFPPIAGGIEAWRTVGESYNTIHTAVPTLDVKTTARLAWIDANRNGERFYSPVHAISGKDKSVTGHDLASKEIESTPHVKEALASVGLIFTPGIN